MNKRFQITLSALLLTLLLLTLSTSAALAARPLALHIEVKENIQQQSGSLFGAYGPAVNVGYVCSEGIVDNLGFEIIGQNGDITIMSITKRFICRDSSGTFLVKMTAYLDNTTGKTTADWRIVGGTGDYTALRGQGTLVGIPFNYPYILDVYDGFVY